jgi:hypothetical protein
VIYVKSIKKHTNGTFPSGTGRGMTEGSQGSRLMTMLLFLTFFSLGLIILLSPVAVAQTEEPKEEVPDPTMDDVIEEITTNKGLIIFGIFGILSLIIYIPMAIKASRIRNMENALPEVLNEIAENIRSGRSVESAFKEVADVRTDLIGKELRRASEEMLYTSFEAAMRAFAQRTGSRAMIRIISLVLIAVESGASLAQVLEKISGELWKVYILKKDREAKSATNASVILWGGVLFTPGVIAFILGVFSGGGGAIDIDMGPYEQWFIQFLMTLGLISIIMRGVAMGEMKLDMIRAPFFTWLPWLIYLVIVRVAGVIV